MFSRPGQADAAKALEVAAIWGSTPTRSRRRLRRDAVTANIQEVHDLAAKLGINGTPSYVIGGEMVSGAIGYDGLQAMVTAMRQCGQTKC